MCGMIIPSFVVILVSMVTTIPFDMFVDAFSLRPWLSEALLCVEEILSGSG